MSAAFAPARILVIRRDNIGDLVCTTPLLAALRRHLPAAHIAVLANSYNAEVLDGNPDIDQVFAYTKLKHRGATPLLRALWDRIRLMKELRQGRFDVAILAKSSFDRHGLRFARMAGARRVIGFAPRSGSVPAGLSEPLEARNSAELHEAQVLMHLLAPLGIETPAGPLRVFPDPVAVAAARGRIPEGRRWMAVHISAREEDRRWPAERFAALIDAITRGPGTIGVVLLWSPGDELNARHPGDDRKAAAILAELPAHPVLAMPTGRLRDLIAALSLCQGFIGADGGALHVAAGLGLPMVALFENDPYKLVHWPPWQVNHELVVSPVRAIRDIPLSSVVEAWERISPSLAANQ